MGARSWTRPYPADPAYLAPIDWEVDARAWRKKVEQVEKLAKLGSFEVDFETGVLGWSAGTYAIFGIDPSTPISIEKALSFYDAEVCALIESRLEIAKQSGEPYDLTVPFRSANGQSGWVRMIAEFEKSGSSGRLLGVLRDITRERDTEELLRAQAYQDILTGLPNRRAFQTHLEKAVAVGTTAALCLIDVDHFKNFNDVHGHAFGDALLQEVARRLRSAVRSIDIVARLGGDEFAVVLHDVRTPDELLRLATKLVVAVRSSFDHEGLCITPTISLGACLRSRTVSGDGWLRKADTALYKAKKSGRDQVCLFRPTLSKEVDEHGRLLDQVRNGLARNEFEAHYQPIVDLRTRIVRGWEALVRWRHPTKGLLLPGRFLAALSDPKMSVAIDEFMLEASLRQMRQWLDAGVPVTCAGVNASDATLRRPDLLSFVSSLLQRYRLTPDRLKIEVLETAFVGQAPKDVAETINQLARLGVVSVLDDFGTGYASLTHLKQFKVERIKLERSFIANLGVSNYDQSIVRCMVTLGRDLNLRVTAEGIETVEQLHMLRQMGCDCGQGYLFARPMHPDDVPVFLSRWHDGKAYEMLGKSVATTLGSHSLRACADASTSIDRGPRFPSS